MDDQIETDVPHSKNISRRKFLKDLGTTITAIATGQLHPTAALADAEKERNKKPELKQPEQKLAQNPETETPICFEVEMIDGVEVYGLKEGQEIKTIDDIRAFYEERDGVFCKKHLLENNWGEDLHEEQLRKIEARQEMWLKQRMLEVAVRRSAWDEFVKRQNDENEDSQFRVSFPTWIQCHVDLMNRCMENAQPPCELEAVLSRIVVVDDKAVTKRADVEDSGKWDEEAWDENGGKGNALDVWWSDNSNFDRTFPQPVDIDTTWAIPNDYRPTESSEFATIGIGWLSENNTNSETTIIDPHHPENAFRFPARQDALSQQRTVWLDFGLIHEWMHRILNGPDEYCFDHEKSNPSPYKQFHVITGNSFHEPNLSPFLSYYLNANWKLSDRRSYAFQESTDFTQRPDKIILGFNRGNLNHPVTSVEITKIRVTDGYLNPNNHFPDKPDQVTPPTLEDPEQIPKTKSEMLPAKNTLVMNQELFDHKPDIGTHIWLIKASLENGDEKWLFLPASAFMMTKLQAEFDGRECADTEYEIDFLWNDAEQATDNCLEMETIHKNQMDTFFADHGENQGGRSIHAIMEVTGTDFYFVWLTRKG